MDSELWQPEFDWIELDQAEPEATELEPELRPSRLTYLRRRLGALLLVAAVGFAGYEIVKADSQPYLKTPASLHQPAGCPPVSHQEKLKVEHVLAKQVNPAFMKWQKKEANQALILPETVYHNAAEAAARANHLTLVDAGPTLHRLSNAEAPFDQLKIVNQYFKHFGFSVSLIHSRPTADYGAPLKPQELSADNPQIGYALESLVTTFADIPIQEVRATGLKHFLIVDHFNNPEGGVAPIAEEANVPNTITASLFSLRDQPDVRHELGHLFDYQYCGSEGFWHQDSALTQLNPPGFKYGTNGRWQNATVSQYGSTNMREDKAEFYSQMLDNLRLEDAHSKYPAVREKYALLLERLDQRVPGLANYLGALAFPAS